MNKPQNANIRSGQPTPRHMIEVLDLEQLDTNLFRSRANQINRNHSLFGGQILGQALRAAALTVDGARPAHSLHGYFLLPGQSDIPVIYDVELTRDGGSFSTRRVLARQRAKPIFHMEASFHREEQGFEHHRALDLQVPDPDQLPNLKELARQFADLVPAEALPYLEHDIVEMKPVNPEDFFMRKSQAARGLYWIRSVSRLPDEPLTQMAALAYISDYFLVSTALLPHTTSVMSGEVMMASLDHAMWFHHPARADEWILVDSLSPFAGRARGFSRAEFYNRERLLVASVAQEGLIRPVKKGR